MTNTMETRLTELTCKLGEAIDALWSAPHDSTCPIKLPWTIQRSGINGVTVCNCWKFIMARQFGPASDKETL